MCLADHAERVQQGLTAAGVAYSILAVHDDKIALMWPGAAGSALRSAFENGPVGLRAPIASIIAFDHDSPPEVIRPAVEAELIVCLSHRLPQITFGSLAERVMPYLGLYGHAARNRLIRKVGAICREVAAAEPEAFVIELPGPNREGMVRFLKTPEEYDTRGRTPAYQSLLRRRPRVHRRSTAHPGQTDLLKLLDEMDNEDDEEARDREGDQ